MSVSNDAVSFVLNGQQVTISRDPATDAGSLTLLDALRGPCGVTSAKDGCAPQGQCGCCTVLVDGRARVACVTPLRRVVGRRVETIEGLDGEVAARWGEAFMAHGASQCGFCTPGIILRLEDRRRRGVAGPAGAGSDRAGVERALQAHLCRCTGWQGITDAAVTVLGGTPSPVSSPERSRRTASTRGGATPEWSEPAARRATLESCGPQRVDRDVALGGAAFAADTAPPGALVAVVGPDGEWVVGESVAAARAAASKVQGRRTTASAEPPLAVPEGDWLATLQTSWVEPAYLETDASWCEPGGEPASPLANGGAFGAKADCPLPDVARRLADERGRAVLVIWSREDTVRHGPKRPPAAGGIRSDGTGLVRVVRTSGIEEAVHSAAPGLRVAQVDVPGPPTSATLRGAGWVEAFCLMVAADLESPLGGRDGRGVRVHAPGAGWARVEVADGGLEVLLGPGEPLDEMVLGSYATGACHMAAGWVTSEALRVDPDGEVRDLTVRSFGVLPAAAMPEVRVAIDPEGARGAPVAVGGAVYAAAATALWRHHGFPEALPTGTAVL